MPIDPQDAHAGLSYWKEILSFITGILTLGIIKRKHDDRFATKTDMELCAREIKEETLLDVDKKMDKIEKRMDEHHRDIIDRMDLMIKASKNGNT